MNSVTNKKLSPDDWRKLSQYLEEIKDLPEADKRLRVEEIILLEPQLKSELISFAFKEKMPKRFLTIPIGERLAGPEATEEPQKKYCAGEKVENYEILSLLGEGAFATVYLVKDLDLDRKTALKISVAEGNEGLTLAQLQHPHIVTVYSEKVIENSKKKLLAMQYVPGRSLEQLTLLLKNSKKTWNGETVLTALKTEETQHIIDIKAYLDARDLERDGFCMVILKWGIQICEALFYAHERNILHLDVKPGNILIDQYGRALLTDFNVSLDIDKYLRGDSYSIGGTYRYMSQEHRNILSNPQGGIEGNQITHLCDLYSLGYVLNELCEEFKKVGGEIPAELTATFKKATSPVPTERYRDINEFRETLLAHVEKLQLFPKVEKQNIFEKYPLESLTTLGALPQLLSTCIGVLYNKVYIVSQLTEAQQTLFNYLLKWVLPVFFTVGIVFWIFLLKKIYPYLKNPLDYHSKPQVVRSLRQLTLKLPDWGAGITTFSWGASALIFPAILHFFRGPLSIGVIWHFGISFLLSWSVALSYSYLIQAASIFENLYAKFWVGCKRVRETANFEIEGILRKTKVSFLISIVGPLFGAINLTLMGSTPRISEDAGGDRAWLISLLILAGLTGVVVSYYLVPRVAKNVRKFEGNRRVF